MPYSLRVELINIARNSTMTSLSWRAPISMPMFCNSDSHVHRCEELIDAFQTILSATLIHRAEAHQHSKVCSCSSLALTLSSGSGPCAVQSRRCCTSMLELALRYGAVLESWKQISVKGQHPPHHTTCRTRCWIAYDTALQHRFVVRRSSSQHHVDGSVHSDFSMGGEIPPLVCRRILRD